MLVVADIVLFVVLGAAFGWLVRSVRYLNRPASMTRQTSVWIYILVGAAIGVLVWYLAWRLSWGVPDLDWILVAILGAAVGIGELSSRYRDEPIRAIFSVPAAIYVLINALASVAALAIGRHFGWLEPVEANDGPVAWSHVLIAGLGAMALMRSSVFQIRVGDTDVGVGPSTFLQSVIDAADRAVDRLRAQERAWAVARVMEKVSPEKAMDILPPYISALMQNLKPEEQGDFDDRVSKIRENKVHSDQVKVLILGLIAMRYTGEQVLSAAVQSLADEILRAAEEGHGAAKKASEKASETKAATETAVAAAEEAKKAIQGSDTPSSVKNAAEAVREAAAVAEELAEETLDQSRESAKAAEKTVDIANSTKSWRNIFRKSTMMRVKPTPGDSTAKRNGASEADFDVPAKL